MAILKLIFWKFKLFKYIYKVINIENFWTGLYLRSIYTNKMLYIKLKIVLNYRAALKDFNYFINKNKIYNEIKNFF